MSRSIELVANTIARPATETFFFSSFFAVVGGLKLALGFSRSVGSRLDQANQWCEEVYTRPDPFGSTEARESQLLHVSVVSGSALAVPPDC